MAIGDTASTNVFGVELGGILVETFQEISAITYGQEEIEVRQVTADGTPILRKQPGPPTSGEVTITRGLDKNLAFTNWVKQTVENHDVDGARQNITIVLMNAQKEVVRRIRLSNAWAKSWEAPALQAGQSGAAQERVTVTYEDVDVEGA
ncbi:phage tail protein [Streptomyces sp. WZ-12]|uniref:phage tail protein n=1 Tax=Streptomyces sp. WZ-12 TaxID=3030210 RepID=UPI002380E722|nr:phage tail protein [Streptomyces sp. WZ-12]